MKKLAGIFVCLAFTAGWLGAASVTVTKPGLGETLIKGSPYTITWTKDGAMPATVRISLRDAVTLVQVKLIKDPADNTGTYPWIVPADVADGQYRIRIKVNDAAPVDDGDAFFISAQAPAGTISVGAPSLNSTWYKGTGYTISWTKTGSLPANVRISLHNASTLVEVRSIVESTANIGTYGTWTVPNDVADGPYRVRVKAIGAAVQGDSASFNIAAAPAAGTIAVGLPSANSIWRFYSTQAHVTRWSPPANLPNAYKLSLMNAAGTAVVKEMTPTSTVVCCSLGIGTDWIKPGEIAPGSYRVRVKSVGTDAFGLSEVFTLSPDYIHITYPTLNKTFIKKATYTIKWDRSGFLGNSIKIELKDEPGNLKQIVTASAPNSGAFDWTVPDYLVSGKYKLVITVLGAGAGGVDNRSPLFNIAKIFKIEKESPLIK